MADDIPPGMTHNPSAWRHRLLVLIPALIGLGIATYLGLYQLGVIATVWEPFFGNGSHVILKESGIARALPIPDALLGALAYLTEVIADCLGGESRWRTAPWAVLLLGVVATLLALGGVVLVIAQPMLYGNFCTLCLTSAACSALAFLAALGEIRAALGHLRREKAQGLSLRQALGGRP
jgi:uncharacterized membrane protein